MTKKIHLVPKEEDSQKTSDGQNHQVVKDLILKDLTYPNMKLQTMSTMVTSVIYAMEELAGGSTRVTLLLTDNSRLIETLVKKYGDIPLLEAVDAILKENGEEHGPTYHT